MKEKGISLIEVVVVIALIGILSLGARTSAKQMERVKFRALVNQIKLTMHAAQQHAHLEGNRVRITNYKRLPSYQQYFSVTVKDQYYYAIPIPSNIQVTFGREDTQGVSNELSFYQNMSPTQGGTVIISHLDLSEQVRITLRPVTGKLTLYEDE